MYLQRHRRKILGVSVIVGILLGDGCSTQRASPGNDADIERLYISAREVDAAVITGATYDAFAQRVTTMTAALLMAKDREAAGDKQGESILAEYSLLADQYQSALVVWQMGMQEHPRGDEPRLLAIQRKYAIRPNREEPLFDDIRDQLLRLAAGTEKGIVPRVRGRMQFLKSQ